MARLDRPDSTGGGAGIGGGRTAAKVTAAQAGPSNVAKVSSTVKVIRNPLATENNPKITKQLRTAMIESARVRNAGGINGKAGVNIKPIYK